MWWNLMWISCDSQVKFQVSALSVGFLNSLKRHATLTHLFNDSCSLGAYHWTLEGTSKGIPFFNSILQKSLPGVTCQGSLLWGSDLEMWGGIGVKLGYGMEKTHWGASHTEETESTHFLECRLACLFQEEEKAVWLTGLSKRLSGKCLTVSGTEIFEMFFF